jgi:putative nucleotidyltransferase with HDIG domain
MEVKMNKFRFYSIKSRITFFTLATIFSLLFVRVIIESISTMNTYEQEQLIEFDKTLNIAVSSLKSPLWDYNLDNTYEVLQTLLIDPSMIRVELNDEYGTTIQSIEKDNFDLTSDFVHLDSKIIMYEDTPLGSISIWMSAELNHLIVIKSMLNRIVFALFEMVLITLVIRLVSSKTTQPIGSLIVAANHIAQGNLETTIDINTKDELGNLGTALTSMQFQFKQHMVDLQTDRDEIEKLLDHSNAMNQQLKQMIISIHQNYDETLRALANAIEVNDLYTKGHCERVSEYALKIATQLQLSQDDKDILYKASILHDIGKIGVATHIINKEDKLTNEEYEEIKKHCNTGYNIIHDVDFLKESAAIVLQHHERYDGLGYPNQMRGNEINLLSRILSVADTFDAMTSSRAYRKTPLSNEQALLELQKNSGTQFDPFIIHAVAECLYEN